MRYITGPRMVTQRAGSARWRALLASSALLLVSVPAVAAAADGSSSVPIDVIVREADPAGEAAERLVGSAGGTVNQQLPIIGGFAATVPSDQIGTLEGSDVFVSITVDAAVQSQTAGWQDATNLGDYVPNEWQGSMLHTGYAIGVDQYWSAGYTGEGIGVALIDTGVVPVEGLTLPGKVVNAADLSFESQNDEFRHMDTYGHGTHLAGIIAGRDPAAPQELTIDNAESYFLGMAPDSHIVNVKVGDNEGAVDVSQVIAAIDWVVQHKDDNGMNIRVLNLSFGTDSTQDPLLDPLSFAVEQAWQHGIVVVVASGNDGNGAAVRNPATNPYVITVGGYDHGSRKGRNAQPIPDWSSCGTDRTVDFLAPGAHIVSLRSPGSRADIEHGEAQVADRFFLGSGTSQSAAVVSGAAALILERNPEYSPDDVKSVLSQGANSLRKQSNRCQGAGVINLHDTFWDSPRGSQNHAPATGLGSLEAARGTDHLESDGVVLEGEQDIMGNSWDGASWSTASAAGASWSGGEWNGASWSGASWSGASWSGASWSGASWSGASWSGASWSGASWSGASWSGASWSGASWSGTSWAGASWSGASWSGLSWE